MALLAWLPAGAAAQGDIVLRGLGGEQLSEADLAQGATIVVVWASWSPKSRNIVERVNQLASGWGDRARVVTVVFQEDRREVEQFLAGKGLSVPVYLDSQGDFSKKYAVTTLPGLLVFRDGKAAYRGRLPDDPARVLAPLLR
jgi:thiol-disulfide isomerase/thioredoxin